MYVIANHDKRQRIDASGMGDDGRFPGLTALTSLAFLLVGDSSSIGLANAMANASGREPLENWAGDRIEILRKTSCEAAAGYEDVGHLVRPHVLQYLAATTEDRN